MDNFAPFIGLGLAWVLLMVVLYVGIVALMLWIFYLIIRAAVKNGILRADEERATRRQLPSPQAYQPPPQPGYGSPSSPYPGQR